MFTALCQNRVTPTALLFAELVHICDVAGARGHMNKTSSLVYNELTHKGMEATIKAASLLTDRTKGEKEAYDTCLSIRAGYLGLDPTQKSDRALTRMGAMIRLFTPEEGRILKEALAELRQETALEIMTQIDIETGREFGRTPTYGPAVLVNLAENPALGRDKEERLKAAVRIGLPFLAAALKEQRRRLESHEADPSIPLNFNQAAAVARSSPELLISCSFTIDEKGNLHVTPKPTLESPSI